MSSPDAFLEIRRRVTPKRPPSTRVADYEELGPHASEAHASEQAARCMGCGVPFCHHRCPLHNVVPQFADLVARSAWRDAYDRLTETDDFPEFTGRLCPAPCESACVLALVDEPVTIREVELAVIEHAFDRGWVVPATVTARSGRRVAVVGSGPAGLAAAQQLRRVGHDVTVYERADRLGGLLRYGIPDYKMHKSLIDRRVGLLEREGVRFETEADVGRHPTLDALDVDAVVLAIGAERGRDLPVPGRALPGVSFAMPYLVQQNRRVAGLAVDAPALSARGADVVIIGGGDTAADCLGNALREGARNVVELSLYDPPPRAPDAGAWPDPPLVLTISPSHEEGGERRFGVEVVAFGGTGRLAFVEVRGVEVRGRGPRRVVVPRDEPPTAIPADLALLAVGFAGVADHPLLDALGVHPTDRGVLPDGELRADPALPPVFAAGDAVTGAALVVTAIADGRRAAAACDAHLRATQHARG